MVNKTIKTYHKVSQFWTMDPKKFLQTAGVLARLSADEGVSGTARSATQGPAGARRRAYQLRLTMSAHSADIPTAPALSVWTKADKGELSPRWFGRE